MAQSQHSKAKIFGFFGICLIAGILSFVLLHTKIFDEIESRTWDWRVQLTADPKKADPSIKIIMIDQSSLEFFANEESIFWPWPRGIYEAVIGFLKTANARGVAFDIIYSEQSSYGVDDDKSFANSFIGAPPVVSAVALRRAASTESFEDLELFRSRVSEQSYLENYSNILKSEQAPSDYSAITLPVEPLLKQSKAFGNVTAKPDSDGIYRHASIGSYVGKTPVIGLPFALFEVGRKDESRINLNDFLDIEGRLAVNFRGPARTYSTYKISAIIQSYRQIINNESPLISPDDFKDSWVFVGMDAPGLLDLRPTPLSELYPGVEFHANVLDNLIHGNFAHKTTYFQNILLSLIVILLITGGVIFLENATRQILLITGVFFALLTLYYISALNGVWIEATTPFVVGLISMFAALSLQYQLEGRQHKFIKSAFKYYLSPQVIEEIIKDPSSLSLGGARRELTIFFSDLAGFTSISESIDPQNLVQLLNRYLSAMTDIILSSGGTVDKYEGDAIIAFWNAPLALEDHAKRAVETALNCQKKLEELRPKFESEFGVNLRMRIGLNTGPVNVGNFGSKERFNYTIIGDAVNLAARLEGTNKVFGTYTMISQVTKDQLGDSITCRKVGDIQVVGKSKAISVYEPNSDQNLVKEFAEALALFELGKLKESAMIFTKLEADPVSQAYLKRISKELDKSLDNFNPVWVLDSK